MWKVGRGLAAAVVSRSPGRLAPGWGCPPWWEAPSGRARIDRECGSGGCVVKEGIGRGPVAGGSGADGWAGRAGRGLGPSFVDCEIADPGCVVEPAQYQDRLPVAAGTRRPRRVPRRRRSALSSPDTWATVDGPDREHGGVADRIGHRHQREDRQLSARVFWPTAARRPRSASRRTVIMLRPCFGGGADVAADGVAVAGAFFAGQPPGDGCWTLLGRRSRSA
jgi:hypothetical protein